jgi:hypothetical protein
MILVVLAGLWACGGEVGPGDGRDGGARRDSSASGEDAGARDANTPSGDAGSFDAGSATMPVIVAAGANHVRYLSIDEGLTWCLVDRSDDPEATGFDNPFLLRNISYTNGRFVTGSWRAVFASTNGFEWTDVTGGEGPASGQWVADIEYGNGWWVATGGYGTAMRSRDLASWENVSDDLPGNEASRSMAFGDGIFVTARDAVGWWSSTDGTGWTELDRSAGTGVIFDGTDFVEPPDYDEGRGVRLRGAFPDGIERSTGGAFDSVADGVETVTHFAFGFAPPSDLVRGRVASELADCLGL